jgi:hypothetical protein
MNEVVLDAVTNAIQERIEAKIEAIQHKLEDNE